MQYQIIISNDKEEVLSSQFFFDELPKDIEIIEMIEEDMGTKAEVVLLENDKFTKHLSTYELIF